MKATRYWKRQRELINGVLNELWDPIGVAQYVQDEYESYAVTLSSMLTAGTSEREIASYLASVETESMGLSASSIEHRTTVARGILALPNKYGAAS